MPYMIQSTITETFLERVRATPTAIGYQFKPTHAEIGTLGQWKEVSFKEFYNDCRLISFGLMGLGIKPRDKVAIVSKSRFEWSLCDMAILGAGGVTIPLDDTNPADDLVYIAEHSEARILILEDRGQLQKIIEKKSEKPDCLSLIEKIIVLEPAAMMLTAHYLESTQNVMTLQALQELGRREEAKDPTRFDQNLSGAKADDLMTICYTSGATGVPKGVMLTHDNLMSVLEDCASVLGNFIRPEGEVILSLLPFSHILGRLESLAGHVFGWRQVFAEGSDQWMANFEEIKPTLIFSVPRIFEKIYSGILNELDSGSPSKRKVFRRALTAGKKYYSAIWTGISPAIVDRVEYQMARTLVFNSISNRLGGRLRFAICGGAPLSKEIGEFFQIIGVQILEGYGLTETCAPVTLNHPESIRFGTVGRPLPEVTLKIAEDGEILIKSRKVFKSYYKGTEEDAQSLNAGWFLTGDIGFIDSDGFLHIVDRKKDLIKTSGGKSIAPQKIENLAKAYNLITQFVVCGDRRECITALVTLDREWIIRYANEHEILFSEYKELIKNPKILLIAQKIIDEVNKKLASFEAIRRFVILPNEFTVEGGELTTSLKIRRKFISKRYEAELDSMYQSITVTGEESSVMHASIQHFH